MEKESTTLRVPVPTYPGMNASNAGRPIPPTPPPPADNIPLPPIPGSSEGSPERRPSPPADAAVPPQPTRTKPSRPRKNSNPPAARSAGTAQRAQIRPPITTPSPPPQSIMSIQSIPQTPEQLVHAVRDRAQDPQYYGIREKPSLPDFRGRSSPATSRTNSTKSAPVGPYVTRFNGKGTMHSDMHGPAVPRLPVAFQSEVGCFPTSNGRGLEGFAIFGGDSNTKGGYLNRPKFDISDLGCMGTGRTGSRAGGSRAGGSSYGSEHGTGTVVDDLKNKVKSFCKGFHVSIHIRFRKDKEPDERVVRRHPPGSEVVYRIKNSVSGYCIFEVPDGVDDEMLTPIDDLKTLFAYNKSLQKSLKQWNDMFCSPPSHWANFIPRAYLRRGYFLAEEVYEYLSSHPDDCTYRIEYEPIGHQPCVLGTVRAIPKVRRRGVGDMW